MKSFDLFRLQWLLMAVGCSGAVHAAVTCNNVSATNLNFGPISGLSTSTAINGNVTWTCSNTSRRRTAYVTLCLNIGNGSGGVTGTTRQMNGGVPKLQYQLYQDASLTQVWGSLLSGVNPSPLIVKFPIAARGSYNGSVTLYGVVTGGQNALVPGSFTSAFNSTSAAITYRSNNNNYPAACGNSTNANSYFPFTVNATITKQCLVAAQSDIDLGVVQSTQTNITGTNALAIACTNTTPYYIGLAPSNGSSLGVGVMSGTGTNTDKVPYQLYSDAGLSTPWGNTATSTSVGNGVSGAGNGSTQTVSVYAEVPSANYTPDSYSDTVIVNVNY